MISRHGSTDQIIQQNVVLISVSMENSCRKTEMSLIDYKQEGGYIFGDGRRIQ